MPAFVAAAAAPPQFIERLRSAFVMAARRPWFAALAPVLLLEGFAAVDAACYDVLLRWDAEARAAGYELPA
jgi:hypothetical protein